MKIALVADSHDNLGAIERAIAKFNAMGVAAVIHAGDFIAPFAVRQFIGNAWEFYGVFGNNDGEKDGVSSLCDSIVHGPTVITVGRTRVGLVHDREAWNGQECDLLVFGHSHKCFYNADEPCLEINPGELGG